MTPVICDDPLYRCRCVLPAGHDEKVHVCVEECGGSWEWLDEVRFHPLTYPHGIMEPLRVVERIAERDGREFVECDGHGDPIGMFRAQRGGITFLTPPSG